MPTYLGGSSSGPRCGCRRGSDRARARARHRLGDRGHRFLAPREGVEEGVALVVDLVAGVACVGLAHDPAVLGERLAVAPRSRAPRAAASSPPSATSRARRGSSRSSATSAYREALAEHRQIVREAFARYQGYEVDYEGDAFFYAFASAQQAVSAVSRGDGRARGRPDRDPRRHPHGLARARSAQVRGHGRAHGGADHELWPRRPGRPLPTTAALVDIAAAATSASTG